MVSVEYGPQPWAIWRFDASTFRLELWLMNLTACWKAAYLAGELDTPEHRWALYRGARTRA